MVSSSPSVSLSSLPTSLSRLLSPIKRKRFDDRSQTAIALSLRAHVPAQSEPSPLIAAPTSTSDVVKWTEPKSITRTLNSPQVLRDYGSPTLVDLSSLHIAVGTEHGAVLGFKYNQEISFVLVLASDKLTEGGSTLSHSLVPVSCTSFSSDGTFLAAGYMDGKIAVWDLSAVAKAPAHVVLLPYDIIHPITLESRFGRNALGHLVDVAVNSVAFVGTLHNHLVSSDVSGLVFFHHGFKKFLRKYYMTQKLLGQNDSNNADPTGKFAIQDCQLLPVGTSTQITDYIGLLAVMTSNILVIVSVRSLNNDNLIYPITHFKISKSKNVHAAGAASSGCLGWYPCIRSSQSGDLLNAKLAYAWNNVITILELDNKSLLPDIIPTLADMKDKDKNIPMLPIYKTARWLAQKPTDVVLSLKWLNSELLTAMVQDVVTTETKIHFFYYSLSGDSRLVEVGSDNLDAQQVSWTSFVTENTRTGPGIHLRSFNPSYKILRHRLVILVNSHSASKKNILTGKSLKWADRLLDCISEKQFLSALLLARDYYCSDNFGHLVLCGLPHTMKERHRVVEPFLISIMQESVVPLFAQSSDNDLEQSSASDLVHLYLQIAAMLTKDRGGYVEQDLLSILEAVLEHCVDIFYPILEEFITSRQIRNISPFIFKSLVEHFVQIDEGEKLTEIICVLDTKTLNIDQTLQLCEKHHLRECSAYIWNELLHDYLTPFVKMIEDLDSPDLHDEQKVLVFTYMSYVLSGRQFPTDEYLSATEEKNAREALCGLLFSLGPVTLPHSSKADLLGDRTDSVFPYLNKFLRFNAFETLVTLNEFFENPCLNTEGSLSITRQYIIEALIDIFIVDKSDFLEGDQVIFAIFVARNYPKYFQFIRLSESVLQRTVETLCMGANSDNAYDCELALESLLPVFDFSGDRYLLEQIKAAGYSNVLLGIYKSEKKYSKALEVWFETQRVQEVVDHEKNIAVLSEMLSSTFDTANNSLTERAQLMAFIERHFDSFIANNAEDMVILANTYNHDIHSFVLNCKDDGAACLYLHEYFARYGPSNVGDNDQLLLKYVQLESSFAPDLVADIIKNFGFALTRPTTRNEMKEFLRSKGYIEALATLLRADNQNEEALLELILALKEEADTDNIHRIEKLVESAFLVCGTNHGLNASLVKELVAITAGASDLARVEFNKGIYQCFRRILDMDGKSTQQESFYHVLNGVMESATLANVRVILQELLTSYYFETEIYRIAQTKVNHGIYKEMLKVKSNTLAGWLIKDKECTSCGKVMWGEGMQEKQLQAYEDRERSKVQFGSYDKKHYEDHGIMLFKCHHGYHVHCLDNLGSRGTCVVCSRDE